MEKTCAACGEKFESASRKAKFCSDRCRLRAHRGQVVPLPAAATEGSEPEPQGSGVEAATRAELKQAGREATALGQAALMLARRLDGAAADTGASVASLAKQLQVTLAAAVDGAHQEADPVDELRKWRDRKRGVAG